MSRLTVQLATGGTPYELQSSSDVWGDITQGGLDDVPDVRGENSIVAQASGQVAGTFNADTMLIRIHQSLWGTGASAALRRASYRTRMDSLKDQLGDPGTMVTIKAYPPNEGLTSPKVATITAQFQRITGPRSLGAEGREFDMEFLCIASPPEWSVA